MVKNSSANIKTRRNDRTFNLKEMYRKTMKSILHMRLNERTSDPLIASIKSIHCLPSVDS